MSGRQHKAKRASAREMRRRERQRAQAEDALVAKQEKLAAVTAERGSYERILNMEAEMLKYLRDENADPNEAFNVCMRIAARMALRGKRGQLWFLQQTRIVWNSQVKAEKQRAKRAGS